MRQRYRLYFREKTGRFYLHDDVTGKQESLHTKDRATAERLFHSRNEAEKQPAINLQIARAYLAATDPQIGTRTWQQVMDEMVKLKTGETLKRWLTAIKDEALDLIRNRAILETRSEHFLRVLETGTVSTNVYLRRIHNFALDMNWLPWPVICKRQWPKIEHKEKRAITLEEHQAIVAREQNPERKALYQLAWHLGASQTDIALLDADKINWEEKAIVFRRKKSKTQVLNSLTMKRQRSCERFLQKGRSFHTYAPCGPATGQPSSSSVAQGWVSKASRFIVTAIHGRNGRAARECRCASRRKPWAIARQSIRRMQTCRKSECRRWPNTRNAAPCSPRARSRNRWLKQ